jgi:uncharacterized ferredoxin-like protein
MSSEKTAVTAVAGLMALAARTAPKGKGVDTILVRVLKDPEQKKLADRLAELGTEQGIGFFLRDAKNIAAADGCVLIGARGRTAVGLNCGACGYETCTAMAAACSRKKKSLLPFTGPNCIIRMTDLGIAIGSAVKTAQIHNVDNRIMYSGGVAARNLGLFDKECTVAYAIPLSATGKNIFFDRETGK